MTAANRDLYTAGAQEAPACQCDRPMPMTSDDDIGMVCGRCGRTTDATAPATARARRALVAVAKGEQSQDWIVPGSFEKAQRGKNPTRAMRVLEQLKQHGPATAPELAAALDDDPAHIRRTTNDLATDGLVVRAGTKPRETGHGRPATLWARNTPSHAPTGSDEAEQPAAADADEPGGTAAGEREGTPSEDAAAEGREAAPDPTDPTDPTDPAESAEPAVSASEAPATDAAVDEDLELAWRQLQVQYVRALIGLINRSGILAEPAPPPHVFDRCERLLGLSATRAAA